jgi:isocitrate dehydrogenase kinase/phosphatase
VADATSGLSRTQGPRHRERAAWAALKSDYAAWAASRADAELAETFFNSVARRVLGTVGTDPATEFLDLALPDPAEGRGVTERFERRGDLGRLVWEVLERHRFGVAYEDPVGDGAAAAAALAACLPGNEVLALELARPIFYRNKGAYLVGRALLRSGSPVPVVLALLNPAGQVRVDAVLVGEDEASRVFSFTRSYFFVEADRPRELVGFLRALMPRKPLAELYAAIGFERHGKTEFYRALLRHVARSEDRFEIAPGARGMVMVVFTLPSYDVVFKLIRDRFDEPKRASRSEVMGKYQLVFRHDRAGRLVEAQEIEHLALPRARFAPDLLAELAAKAAATVTIGAERVVLQHVYTERRVTPLDLYLRRAEPAAARAAALDYGQALRDLAATNIFPGDLLLKNFGVTRLGRVVFYDYDELSRLTDLRFRELPPPRDPEEEMAGEPWFYVDEHDVFPEEILGFLGLAPELREAFLAAHAELLGVGFWTGMQRRHLAGEVLDLFPYPNGRRLPRGA